MKYIAGLLAIVAIMSSVAMAAGPIGENPIPSAPMGPGNSGPSVYLLERAVNIGIDVDGSGSSINPTDIRGGFYAFTGEKIMYYVLVRDQNGAQDINLVKWVKDGGNEMGPCEEIPVEECYGTPAQGTCSNYGYQQCGTVDGCSLACDRYVDNVGNCDGNLPCDTTIKAAVDAASDNEVICVFDGTYSGAELNKPVKLVSINVHGAKIDCKTSGNGILIKSSDITVDGFEITNCIVGVRSYGGPSTFSNVHIMNNYIHYNSVNGILVVYDTVNNLVIENNIIDDTYSGGGNGIGFGNGATVNGLTIRGNTISNSKGHGIYISGSTVNGLVIEQSSIKANKFEGIMITNSAIVNDLTVSCSDIKGNSGNGLVLRDSASLNNAIVKDTDIQNNLQSGLSFGAGTLNGLTVERCTFSGNGWEDIDIGVHWMGVLTASDININHNSFSGPAWAGVYIADNAVFGANDIVINENNILNGVSNSNTISANAENNWWGCAAGPGNSGCSGATNVDYDPWATSPFTIKKNCPGYTPDQLPICEGTPTSCGIITEEYKCEVETEGCNWLASGDIPALTNLKYDEQTDKVFYCQLTVESQWSGSGEIQVSAEDTAGASGATLAENWDFNPPLIVDVDTNDGNEVTFGEVIKDQEVPGITAPNCERDMKGTLDPDPGRKCQKYILEDMPRGEKLCDVSFSTNKIVVENIGTTTLWTFIAATNFYDSTGMAKCPWTNSLSANQFEYRAIQGSWDSGWRVMPAYAPNMECSGPTLYDTCRGACRIATGCPFDVLAPMNHIEVALKVVWPTPCIGTFDTGDIVVIVRAI
jgi:hypothetical protein